MDDLIAWLDAQIAYDDAELVNARVRRELPTEWIDRLENELHTKRAILGEHHAVGGDTCLACCAQPTRDVIWDGEEEHITWLRQAIPAPCPTVRLLAAPYAGRPGWRPEWAPDPA